MNNNQGAPHRQAAETALSVAGLCFGYPDRPAVLQDVALSVQAGERVGLIGANGSGKTTLFLALCGVHTPLAGAMHLFGQPIVAGQFRPEIGLVFQNPNDQLFCPCVRDDVAFGVQNMGVPAPEVAARVTEALTAAGVLHLADRVPHHLSGGEKRMVAIAGVLAMRPRLVLYDEPDANLDSRARRRLIRFLQAASETILIASHDLELILEVCNRVILMDRGRIVAAGQPEVIMGDAALMEAHGLECPHSLRVGVV